MGYRGDQEKLGCPFPLPLAWGLAWAAHSRGSTLPGVPPGLGDQHTFAMFITWMLSASEPWSNSPATTTSEVLEGARERGSGCDGGPCGVWGAHVCAGVCMSLCMCTHGAGVGQRNSESQHVCPHPAGCFPSDAWETGRTWVCHTFPSKKLRFGVKKQIAGAGGNHPKGFPGDPRLSRDPAVGSGDDPVLADEGPPTEVEAGAVLEEDGGGSAPARHQQHRPR